MKRKSALQLTPMSLCILLAFVVYSSPAKADSTSWTGAVSSDWFTGGNWTNGVPTSQKDAFINNGGKAKINGPGAMARSLTLGVNLGESGALSIDGSTGGSLLVPAGSSDAALDAGTIVVGYRGGGTLQIKSGGTVASGTAYIAALGVPPGAGVPSNGAVTVDGVNSTWAVSGQSSGQIFIGGNGSDQGGTALLNVANGGVITINNMSGTGRSVTVGTSGTLTGNGTITTTGNAASMAVDVYGTLAPAAELRINSNLVMRNTETSTATTLFNVTPSDQDGQGFSVTGRARLAGRVIVNMTGDFTHGLTQYTLIHLQGGQSVQGTFESVSINYPTSQGFEPKITYDTFDVYLGLVFNQ